MICTIYEKDLQYSSVFTQHCTIESYSNTRTYIQDDKFYVETTDTGRSLAIDMLNSYEDDKLQTERIFTKKFSSPIRCSSIYCAGSDRPSKCIVGLERSAVVQSMDNQYSQVLNTKASAVICVHFKAVERENFVFAGCRNKLLYGYDLRAPSKVNHLFEHSSCVSDILMNNNNPNNLVSCDYNGQIFIWDLRMNRSIYKFQDFKKKCSIKLSKCGNYLISGKNLIV